MVDEKLTLFDGTKGKNQGRKKGKRTSKYIKVEMGY